MKEFAKPMRVGAVDDREELEADRLASVVVERLTTTRDTTTETSLASRSGWDSATTRRLFAGPASLTASRVQRSAHPGSDRSSSPATPSQRRVQRRARSEPVAGSASGPQGGDLDAETSQRIQRASGGGAALDPALRPSMESALGADLGNVRIHTDSALPADVGAVAFAHGNDVHFGPGQYQPNTSSGLHTLSHELAHVVQNGGAPLSRIHRLMSSEQFKKSAKEGTFQVHGTTMGKIDELLDEFDTLKATQAHLKPGANGIDQAITILTHLHQDIALWKRSHAQDKGRKKQAAAIDALRNEVVVELNSLHGSRDAYQQAGVSTGELEIKENKFVQDMTGSASSIFDKLSPIIGAAIPSPGDGAQLDLTVKIPVDPSSASYVGFSFSIALQRQDRSTTKISLSAAVNGGAQIMGVADVGLELGAFIEAQGKDPKAALQLISWGWYRSVRESKVLPREVANFMWGGSTGSVGWVRSEDWAANVERENLLYDESKPLSSGVGSDSTTNAYVRTGGYGSAAASGAIKGIATLEGSAKLSGGTHFDKNTVEARKDKRGAKLGEAEAMPTRGKTTYLGTRFMKFEAALAASVGPFSGSISGAIEGLWDQSVDPDTDKKRGAFWEYLSGSLTAGATIPMGAQFADKIADGIIQIAPSVINLVKTIATKANKENNDIGAAGDVGQLVAQGEEVAKAFELFPKEAFDPGWEIASDPMKSLSEQLASEAAMSGSSGMSISIAFGKNLGDKGQVAVDLTLNSEQAIALDASIVGLAATRRRRVLRLKFSSDEKKWYAPEID